MTFTELLAEFCSSLTYEELDPTLIEKAKMAIIDTYGVIIGGMNEDVSLITLKWAQQQGGNSNSTILGHGTKTTASLAALVNATMGHALDYDDVNMQMIGHPSVVIFPAVLAIAEQENKTGKELLTSFILGTEVSCKLGSYLNPSHYYRGWHATSTVGVLGVAVAIGKLYGFDKEQMRSVLGLAGSMMIGLRKNFGTMSKPFHAGLAARNGIDAAQLISRKMTASLNIFEEKMGIFEVYSDLNGIPIFNLGQPWSLIEPGFDIKKYPCCYETHRMLDAAWKMCKKESIDTNQIEKIECIVPKGGLAPLIHNDPQNGLEAKFSMEYVVAAMLTDKKVNLNTFTDDMIFRPEIRNLMSKISLYEDSSIKLNHLTGDMGYVVLKVYVQEKVYEEKVYNTKGSGRNPLSISELKEKFTDCYRSVDLSVHLAEKTFNKLLNLESLNNISELIN